MDFTEEITALAAKAQKVKGQLATEQATKNALIMPFIKALGYDIFNPSEVVPEFVADVAGRKGEKVDYAIMHDGKPSIIIECKCCGDTLCADRQEQLHRYFLTVDARIAVLTDGIRYLFFSDTDEDKKLDSRPFMELNLDNVDSTLIPELRKLCKGKFDLETALETANQLKYNREFKQLLAKQLNVDTITDNFVDFFIRETYSGRATKNVREMFKGYVHRAFNEFIAEQLDDRIKAVRANLQKEKEEVQPEEAVDPKSQIETTPDEWKAFYLVKSILMGTVDSDRVVIRDAVNYCSVLLDDSNRNPLIRFYFNDPDKMRIELYDDQKKRIPHDIVKVDDILFHAEAIRATALRYESSNRFALNEGDVKFTKNPAEE